MNKTTINTITGLSQIIIQENKNESYAVFKNKDGTKIKFKLQNEQELIP